MTAPTLPTRLAIDGCRRCPLWERATQGVPGEGDRHPRIVLVGEQPGDEEDRQGKPFVGPAGRLLRQLLAEAGLDIESIYLTNVVKHFSWEPRGKRRIHKTPTQREVAACADWLEAELAALKPVVIVALGATALSGLLGHRQGVAAARPMTLHHARGARIVATYHPSALLRAIDESARSELRRALVADLRKAKDIAGEPRA